MISRTDATVPPNDLEAERALLSSVLLREAAFAEVQAIVRPEIFHAVTHQAVWESLQRLHGQNTQVDLVTVANDLDRHGMLERAGGPDALAEIFNTVPHGFHAERYAEIVLEKWQQRELQYLCREVLGDDAASSLGERISTLESGCQRILESGMASGPVSSSDAVMALSDRWASGEAIGQPTGFVAIDKLVGGLRPGTLNILAARPGQGKTALAGGVAKSFVLRGNPALFCSLEMTREEIVQRYVSLESGIDYGRLDRGETLDEVELDMAHDAMSTIGDWPLRIDDTPEQSMRHIAASMRLTKRKHGLDLGIVDYLQLVRPSDARTPREQQVAEISRSLKVLARELKIPLLLLSQLNRDVEKRDSKKPRLSDLRESGSVEQDADSVWFIYTPNEDDPHRRDVVIAKNRHGPTGQVSLDWSGRVMRFRDCPEIPEDVGEGFE